MSQSLNPTPSQSVQLPERAALRSLLSKAFSDEELRDICYDHFKEVYEELGTGTGKKEIVRRLIDYAERRLLTNQLLQVIAKENPAQFEEYQRQLPRVVTTQSAQPVSKPVASGGRVIINTVGLSALINPKKAKDLPTQLDFTSVNAALTAPDYGNSAAVSMQPLLAQLAVIGKTPYPIAPVEMDSLTALGVNSADQLYFLAGTNNNPVADPVAICGLALTAYYTGQNIVSRFVGAGDYVLEEATGKITQPDSMLKALEQLVGEVRQDQPNANIVINISGGFKINAMQVTLLGLVYKCEIYQYNANQPDIIPAISLDLLSQLGGLDPRLSPTAWQALDAKTRDLYRPDNNGYQLLSLLELLEQLRKEG